VTRKGIDRRTLLRGILGGAAVSIGLPPLELFLNSHGTAYASGEAFPTRLGLFCWGNGNIPSRWTPAATGVGDAWALSDQLAPLQAHKRSLAVVTGLDILLPNVAPHGSGAVGILTGRKALEGPGGSTYPSPTLDQVAANAIGASTRFKSIEYGAKAEGGLSYGGPYALNPAEESPYALFQRLFGAGFTLPGDTPIIDPAWALRRSVLDAVGEDSVRMRARLGVADQRRLEQHLDGVRALELRLARLEQDPPDLAACTKPTEPELDYPDLGGRAQLREKNRVMSELVAMAWACDQTRVVSNFITHPVNDVLFPDATAGHHQLTHDEPGDQAQVHAIVQHVMECFSDTLAACANIAEGDGTVLDHCAWLGTSEVSLGRLHSLEDYPLLIAGSANGRLLNDIHVRSAGGESTSHVILSVLRAVGVTLSSWGEDDNLVTEGYAAIEA
jgi:hypothetical protein